LKLRHFAPYISGPIQKMNLRTPAPVWIIQTAVQNASSWQLTGDPPILTEHFTHQFAWMNEAYVEGDYERAHYADDCGLTVSASLRRLLDPA
jgi:hypothetical protein